MAESVPSLQNALEGLLRRIIQEEIETLTVKLSGHPEFLTAEQLADRLKVPTSWVYEQSRQGAIPTHRIGRYIRFDLNEVLASQKKE